MRNVLKMAVALVLALGLCSNVAFATNVSSMTSTVTLASGEVIGANGETYDVKTEAVEGTAKEVLDGLNQDVIAEVIANSTLDSVVKLDSAEKEKLTVAWSTDLVLYKDGKKIDGTDASVFPVDVKFDVSALRLDRTKHYLFHYSEKAGKWEVVDTKLSGDAKTLTGTFHSLSPVALVIVGEDAEDSGNGSTGSTGGSSSAGEKSPKTGDVNIQMAVGCIIVASAAACLIYRKKVN